MRWRVLLIISIGANLLLAAGWYFSHRHGAMAAARSTNTVETTTRLIRTNVVVRRQFLSWSQLEAADYPAYIANLRAINCPEQTIRDIIIADVNALYAKRRATEIVTPQQEWWRSEPDPEVAKLAADKTQALDLERRALLTKLLGPDWEGGDLASLPRPARRGVVLDGPVLGTLPVETKQAVAEITARGEDRLQAYLDAQRAAGKNPDPAELARLRAQVRTELAGVLSPGQMEEYLLRYSQDANNLRSEFGQLKYFDATPDEFRAAFRATDSFDQQLAALGDSMDPNIVAQRNSLLQQRDNALKLALGTQRYEMYQALHDPLYQQALAQAIQAGDPGSVDAIYGINLAAQLQQSQIQSNTNMSDEERAIQLKQLELDQMKAAAEAAGQIPPEPPPQPPAPPTTPHVIEKGETVATLSLQTGVPISAIKAANPDLNFSTLQPGDVIRVPQPSLTPQSLYPRP